MSLQGLISGSECAVPANPLSQVLKHTEGDRSLQQDRIAGPSSGRLHHLPGTTAQPSNERDIAMARQFFETGSQGSSLDPSFAMSFRLPPPEMARLGEISGSTGPDVSRTWAMEHQFHQPVEDSKIRAVWAAEFGNGPQQFFPDASMLPEMSAHTDYQQRPSHMSTGGPYSNSMPMGMYGMNMTNMYHGNYGISSEQDKGKGKLKEADLEAAFAKAAASFAPNQAETSRIVEVDDGVTDVEQALKRTTLREDTEDYHGEFQEVWDQLQNSDVPPPQEDLAIWEAEFNQLMTSQREADLDYDFGAAMQEAFQSGDHGFENKTSHQAFDDEGLPILTAYSFDPNNKYLELSASNGSFLADAKAVLNQNGSLSEAALLLEAAIQKGDLGDGGYESWILLGETRNMDEREELGMRALVEGVKRAEAVGAAGAGQLSLAISYTNEAFERASYTMLLRWMRTRFPSQHIPEETVNAVRHNSLWDAHSRVTEVFLNLARTQHSQSTLDPDVQIGLGILFYTNSEFDRAKDCFESALSVRPRDYLLWNRLGSSLSNGNKPEEALGAYHEALKLHPTYTRAIYNVGVACLNIGAHKEAAEHFLSALTMQQSNNGETGDQLWSTLRRAFLAMDRLDLAELAKPENKPNLEVFRKEGFDF